MNDHLKLDKKLVDLAFEGILLLEQDGTIAWANSKVVQLLGANNSSHLVGKSLLDYTHTLYHAGIAELLEKDGLGEGGELKEVIFKKRDDLFPAKARFFNYDADLKGCYILDIIDIKQSEERLFEVTEKINAIIKTAVDGIITIDTRGVIETVNPAVTKLFGYQPEEMIGRNVRMLMPEPDKSRHDQYLDNYHKTGEKKIIGIGREVTAMKKDGTLFPISLGVSEVNLKKRTIYTGLIHDLSRQKMAEEQLRRTAEDLKRSNRELENFAYVSSHDLQEPLRKIRAFGDRIKTKDYTALSEKSKDYLDRMLNASMRMQELINDLLSFSRVSSRAKPFVKVDLNKVFEEVKSDLEISIEKSNAQITANQLPVIEADALQMRQLFQNLLSNAIKFVPENKVPEIKVTATGLQKTPHLKATPGDELVELRFSDNGIGFNEVYANKIFNIFSRLEGRKYQGSGMGLSICKKIVNRHGGDIKAESEEGKGTTFIVKLATKQTRPENG